MKKVALFLSIAMNIFFILMLFWFWACVPKPSAPSPAPVTRAQDHARHLTQEGSHDHAQAMDRAPDPMAVARDSDEPRPDARPSQTAQDAVCTTNPSTGVNTCSFWCQWPSHMLHTVINWVKHMQRMMHHIAQHWHSACQLSQESTQASITPQLATIV